jgi:6-phosphogluconate dehydrogenase
MQKGMIGLGRMGADMVRRLMRGGHECVAHDLNADTVARLSNEGARGVSSLEEFVETLTKPRVAWLMVPAASVEQVVGELSRRLEPDVIIDGGNSHISTTFGVRKRWRRGAFTTWMSVPAEGSGGSSADSAR